jgi:hypothetical protein
MGCQTYVVRFGVMLSLFSFSSRSLFEYGHLTIISSWAWSPLYLLVMRKLLVDSSSFIWGWGQIKALWSLPLLSLLVSILFVGAHPQMVLQLSVASYVLSMCFCVFERKYCWWKFSLFFLMAHLMAFGPAFFQLYETAQSVSYTGRHMSAEASSFSNEGVMGIASWAKAIFPFFWGSVGRYWGQYDFWFGQVYLGIMGLVSLPMILWSSFLSGAKCSVYVRPLLVASLLLAILSMGNQTPLHQIYQFFVPGASMFRLPFRHVYNAHLFYLPLLLIVAQNHLDSRTWSKVTLVLGGGVLMVISLSHTLFMNQLLELFQYVLPERVLGRMSQVVPLVPSFYFEWVAWEFLALVCFLCYFKRSFRWPFLLGVLVALYSLSEMVPLSRVSEDRYVAARGMMPSERVVVREVHSEHNIHLSYGIQSVTGYDSLSLSSFRQFLDTLVPQNWKKHTREQLYAIDQHEGMEFLGFGYTARTLGELQQGPKAWDAFESKGLYYLTQSFDWPGRQDSPFTAGIKLKQQKLKEKWREQGYSLEEIVSEDPPEQSLKLLSYDEERIVLHVSSSIDTILGSSENNYSLWKVRVNGQLRGIETWLGTFRAIPLKKGAHEIEFFIDRKPFYSRLVGSFFVLIFLMIWGIYGLKVDLARAVKVTSTSLAKKL